MNDIELLKEKVLRLEQQLRLISRSNQGLSIDPALNTLGQDTEIKGNLDVAGDLDITGDYLQNGLAHTHTEADITNLNHTDPNAVYLDGSRTMTGDLKTQGNAYINYGEDGEISIISGNGALELGKTGRSVAGTPYIDFHSSQNSPDYDARIIASGGSSAGSGQGQLNIVGGSILKNNNNILSAGAGEINAITAKTAPALGDLLLIEDSAASYQKKELSIQDLLKLVYPVGAIYMSVVSTSPATLFGFGTWSAWGTGRVPVGIDTGQTEFNTVEKTGGAKTHTLQTTEIPAHTHIIASSTNQVANGSGAREPTNSGTGISGSTGGGGAHNNLQPYIVCYMWKRTA